MHFLKEKTFFKLFSFFTKRRKKQLYFLIVLLIINGVLEFFSTATVIPVLSIITSDNINDSEPFIASILSFLKISDPSSGSLFFTLAFCVFVLSSTFLRIFNIAYIYRLSAKVNSDISNLIFKNNMYQSYYQYTKKNSSEIISLALDKVRLATSCIDYLLTVIASSLIGISIIISLLFIKWEAVLMGLIFIFLYYLIIYQNIKKIVYSDGQVISKIIPLRQKTLQEGLEGYKDVVVNNLENIFINLFNKYHLGLRLKEANLIIYTTFPRILIEGIFLSTLVILGYLLFKSNLNFVSYLPIIGSFVYAFQRLLPIIQQIYFSLANYKYRSTVIRDVLNDLEECKNN